MQSTVSLRRSQRGLNMASWMLGFGLLYLLWTTCVREANAAVLRCAQVEKQGAPVFQLVRRCSRSAMSVVAQGNVTSARRCADLAASRRGLAFNYSPRGSPRTESQFTSSCLVLECPEFEELSSLQRDEAYDYYSLYTDPMPRAGWSCVPGVGLFRVRAGAERANHSEAGQRCREDSGELAHVLSEARTAGLSTLLSDRITDSKNRSVGPVKQAFVNLDDTAQEGLFLTSAEEPLECFPYRAWSPGEPRNRSAADDCVVLERRLQRLEDAEVRVQRRALASWAVTDCSRRLAFICELYPGGGSPDGTCAHLSEPGDREACLELLRLQGSPEDRCEGWDLLDVPPPAPTTTAAPDYGGGYEDEGHDGGGGGGEEEGGEDDDGDVDNGGASP